MVTVRILKRQKTIMIAGLGLLMAVVGLRYGIGALMVTTLTGIALAGLYQTATQKRG